MKYNLRNTLFDENGATQLENRGTQSEPQNHLSSKDMHTGLTQYLPNERVKEFFHVAPGAVLSLPDTTEKLYRVEAPENCRRYTKIRYLCWGSEHDAWLKSKSIWDIQNTKSSCAAIEKLEQTSKKDILLISCDSSQLNNSYFASVDLSIKSESNKLPEILTILSSYMPTCRFVPIKLAAGWFQLQSSILLECVEAPNNQANWQKLFAVGFKMCFTCL